MISHFQVIRYDFMSHNSIKNHLPAPTPTSNLVNDQNSTPCHNSQGARPIDDCGRIENISPQVMDRTKYSPINWELCIEKVSGNHAIAVEILACFVEELQLNRVSFIEMYQQNDRINFEKLAHKLHGACCFCGVIRLKSLVIDLETKMPNIAHVDEVRDTFLQFIEEIDAVIKDYRQHYIN